jgi:hypothetical protein
MIINELINALEASKNILRDFIGRMTETEINCRVKNYWTVYEHLRRLAFAQNILLHRIKQFIAQENPVIKPSAPANMVAEKNYYVSNLLELYYNSRNQQIAAIKNIDEKIFNKKGRRPEYKKYTLEILIRHILLHDAFHMYRMEELRIKKDELILDLESV